MALPASFEPMCVSRIQTWAPDLITLQVDHIPTAFTPGQFFQLALDFPEGPLKRSYSAASAPGEPLEFFLSLVPDGKLTPGLFALKKGDHLGVDPKALGFFTLSDVPDCKALWLIATGTGLGPYISMVRHGAGLERFERVVVVHGSRTRDHLSYADELKAADAAGKIRYIPVASRDEPHAGGIRGRITTAFASGELEQLAGAAIDKDSHVLFCGNPQMIEEMTAAMKARGLTKHKKREPGHYNFEKYW